MTTLEQEASISQWPDASKDDFTDDELSEMGADAMQQETDRCAKEFTATVERWAEAASRLIQRQVKVV